MCRFEAASCVNKIDDDGRLVRDSLQTCGGQTTTTVPRFSLVQVGGKSSAKEGCGESDAGLVVAVSALLFASTCWSGPLEEVKRLSTDVWRPSAPFCKDKLGRPFPSKIQANGECDDRDSVIFLSLLLECPQRQLCLIGWP